jgi:hypothetical protein
MRPALRPVRSPHLSPEKLEQLYAGPAAVLDPEDLDRHILDVLDGRAVYDAAALEMELGRDWFWFNTVPGVAYMGAYRPVLRWPDNTTTEDDDE